MERLDAIERQALETLKEVRAMREEMKASSRPSPKGKGERRKGRDILELFHNAIQKTVVYRLIITRMHDVMEMALWKRFVRGSRMLWKCYGNLMEGERPLR